jgi:hypothetical protein
MVGSHCVSPVGSLKAVLMIIPKIAYCASSFLSGAYLLFAESHFYSMVIVDIGLAITRAVEQNASLLVVIAKKINEARRFRTKCEALRKDAEILCSMLDKNRDTIDSLQSLATFKTCLADIEAFFTSCRDWSAFNVGLEVFVKQRFPA